MQSALSGLFILIFLLGGIGCARIGSPEGGSKDETPPGVKKSEPPNYTTNFENKSIEILFDEFIVLKDINEKLIISPPLENKPFVRTKGKSVIITIEDTLIENTTYTFNFNDAIVDNNEGNAIENFQFVFSTGHELDSLAVKGNIVNANDLKIPEGVIIVLYEDPNDSAFYKERPLYLTKPDEEGNYLFRNLKTGTYRLFALGDENMNYQYDPPEFIAFSDSLLSINPQTHPPVILNDTGNLGESPGKEQPTLFLFREDSYKQYLKTSERRRKEYIQIIFNETVHTRPELILPDDPDADDWFIEETFILGDTIGLWLTDTALINREIIDLTATYFLNQKGMPDSMQTDTLRFRFTESRQTRRKTNIQSTQAAKFLLLQTKAGSGYQLDIESPVYINSPTPILKFFPDSIELFSVVDSTKTKESFTVTETANNIRQLTLMQNWKEETKYEMYILPGGVTDIYGLSNDTTIVFFNVRSREYYGNIRIELEQVRDPLIIQLLDNKEIVLRETRAGSDTTIAFNLLHPQSYLIKAIRDVNNNGKWDSGSWLLRKQPERIDYYPETIQLRSNWDFKKNWTPKFNNKIEHRK